MKIPAGRFKAECLKLIDQVARRRTEVVITKRGKPVARLVPVVDQTMAVKPLLGWMKGSVEFLGDVVSPIDETSEGRVRAKGLGGAHG